MKNMKSWMVWIVVAVAVHVAGAQAEWPKFALSKDGTPISYEVKGSGEPTLIFIHGWSCDARYWREQIPFFSTRYRVVTLDLAGHGHSGMTRSQYTMTSMGEDVKAVAEAVGAPSYILIGHSMGGEVMGEAARLMPDRVKGLIGVDTIENVEFTLTPEALAEMATPLEKDFRPGCRAFVGQMISSNTAPELSEWILSDMSAAPPTVALSAMKDMLSLYRDGGMAKLFDEVRAPVRSVNGDAWPVNYEANRRHMTSFDAVILKGADHFLMLARPEEFNTALEQTIRGLEGPAPDISPTP